MKIVIIVVDGAPTPSVRGLATLNREEDVLVLLHSRGATHAKNLVKERAALPPERVVEAEVGNNPTSAIEKVFASPAVAKLPRQTEILVLPTTGWATPESWGGKIFGGWRPPTMEINAPSPGLMAMVTMAIFQVANGQQRDLPQVVIPTGDNLLWVVGKRVIPAHLTIVDWTVILGHSPVKGNSAFAEFLKEVKVSPSWDNIENSRKTGTSFASGLAEVNGRAFWVISTNSAPGAELKLKVLETILQLKNRGGDLPVLVLANCQDAGGLQGFLKTLTLMCVSVLDMGEDPIVNPISGWEGFTMDNLI